MLSFVSGRLRPVRLYQMGGVGGGMGDAQAVKEMRDLSAIQSKADKAVSSTVSLTTQEKTEVTEFIRAADSNTSLSTMLAANTPEMQQARECLGNIKAALEKGNAIPTEDMQKLKGFISTATVALNTAITQGAAQDRAVRSLELGNTPEQKTEAIHQLLDQFSAVGSTVRFDAALKVGGGFTSKLAEGTVQGGIEGGIQMTKVLGPDGKGKWQMAVDVKALLEVRAELAGFLDVEASIKAGGKMGLMFDNSSQAKEFLKAVMTGDVDKVEAMYKKHGLTALTVEGAVKVEAGIPLGKGAGGHGSHLHVKVEGKTTNDWITFQDGSKATRNYVGVTAELGLGDTAVGKKLGLKEIGVEYEYMRAEKNGVVASEHIVGVVLPKEQLEHMLHSLKHTKGGEVAAQLADMLTPILEKAGGLETAAAKKMAVALLAAAIDPTTGPAVQKAIEFLSKLDKKGSSNMEVGFAAVFSHGELHGIEIFAKGEKKLSISGQAGPLTVTGDLRASFKGAILIPVHH